MPIKWSGLRVIEAMDMAEECVSQAIEPLEQALLVAEEAARIPNLPDYMKDRINRLVEELKRLTGGVIYGHETPSYLVFSIDSIRGNIPKDALEHEKAREKAGKQQVLV
ncbi:MAG: hypothetical protein QQM50_06460 [Dehalococcoides mccartyi]|uniref:hypothetical protein n=1 Tax=Dehalococcoides TaxID=61434 RepID=UPI002737A666|nr:hypothetical protein [Dehalococcoides mccartyi]MDP4280171.1 hypothetical protein [Dehalococcoides mccartyi]